MWIRLATVLAVAWLVTSPAAADQSSPKPPANDDGLTCHAAHVDAKQFAASIHGPLACVDCHAALAKVTEFPHDEKVAKVACATCHDQVASTYHDTIRAWAKEKAGLVVAPACADCHGKHDIRPHTDSASRVFRTTIPATCGGCHAGIREQFDRGIHAAKLKIGDTRAPSCADCHTAHAIQRADTDKWRLAVTAECGTCHAPVVESFRRTFHGKVTEIGFTAVATCSDCHGAHAILPAANSASTVSRAHLVETCARCHPGANERFVRYDPHPNPTDYTRRAVLWCAHRLYCA